MAIVTPPAIQANPGWPFQPTNLPVSATAFYAQNLDANDVPLPTMQFYFC
jgi:hypothetical protein